MVDEFFFSLSSVFLIQKIAARSVTPSFTGIIQFYLTITLLLPLGLTSFFVLNLIHTSYKDEIEQNYQKTTRYISDMLGKSVTGDIGEINNESLAKIRNFSRVDMNVYNLSGYLTATSQPEIFEQNFQNRLINPKALNLLNQHNSHFNINESIQQLDYKVSYSILRNHQNQKIGFIAIPFFDSINHLERQRLEVFGSIFSLIFILAISVSRLVIDQLVKPLRLVADKMKKIDLLDEKFPINYYSNDIIGKLVENYNKMLVKLEKNKKSLSQIQKEIAWKEIAKQVAHEIKNPLTPMKLKIQQLMRNFEKEKREQQILKTLLD